MKDRVLRVGVIGLGVMGARHAQVCRELRGLELLGVADIKPEVAQRMADQLGLPGYTDYRELLEDRNLAAVVIAASHQFHREPCDAAAATGLDIFLEKPIAMTVADGEA